MVALLPVPAASQTFIALSNTTANSYTQNFDSLGTATVANAISGTTGVQTALGSAVSAGLNGWHAAKIGGTGTAATAITANNGSFTSGGVANYGSTNAPANTDRSLGGLSSGSTIPGFGALIVNETGQTLTGVQISFTAKFWRSSTSVQNVLTFGYGAVDGTTVTTNNFLTAPSASALPAANVVGPAPVTSNGPLDGNSPANQSAVSSLTIPQALAPGAVMYIRWQDANEAGNDAGLAVDDLSLTALAGAPPATAPFVAPVTVPPLGITRTQAGANSEVTGDGGSPITGRGFVYSVSSVNPSPTLGGTGVSNVPDALAQVGSMTGTLTGLSPSTTYAVRSYASNAVGTTYSTVTTFTTPDAPIAFSGSYSQSFATYTGTVPTGWTAISSSNSSAYGGDWGTGSSGGFRGVGVTTGNVLGYQHTSSTGVLSVSVSFVNSTGALLDALNISYLGRTALPANTRTPEWIVSLNGTAVASLAYSTGNTDGAGGVPADLTKSAQLTGLGIAPGAEFTISWASERGTGTGNSRQIGLADFSIVAVDPTAPVIAVSPSSIQNLTATQGAPGASTNFTASAANLSNNITVAANDPVNFAISTNNADFTNTLTLATNEAGGLSNTPVFVRLIGAAPPGAKSNTVSLVSGSVSTNVSVAGTVAAPPAPSLAANPTNITGLQAIQNSASPAPYDSYLLSGTAITNSVTISAPTGLEVSFASDGSGFGSSLTVPSAPPGGVLSTNVFVRVAPTAPLGVFTNFITNSTIGGTGNTLVQVSGQVVAAGTTVIEPANNTALSGFATVRPAPSTNQQITVSGLNLPTNLTILPPIGWEISATNSNNPTTNGIVLATNPAGVVSNTLLFIRLASSPVAASYTDSALRLVSGTNTNNVLLSGAVTDPPPSIAVSTNNLTGFATTVGTASAAQNFSITASNLTNNVIITPPAGFAISTNATAFSATPITIPSGQFVSPTTVSVRLTGVAQGNPSGNVSVASTGAATQNVAVSGTVTPAPSFVLTLSGTLTNFTTPQGLASAPQSFVVQGSGLSNDVTVSAPANLQFTTNTNNASSYVASLVLPVSSGALSNTVFARIPDTAAVGGPTTNVITASSGATNATTNAVTTVSSNTSPFILANPTSLSGFSTTEGTPSTNQTFKVAATNLTSGPLSVAASSNYEVSLDGTNFSTAVNLNPVAPAGAIVPMAGPITYNDATNDIAPAISSGGGTLDIVRMEVSDTASDLVFSLTINGNTTTPNDWGNFMIGIANGKSAGATNTTGNGWNRPINMITPTNGGMTHWIGSWVNGPAGGAQLWSYNGTAWQEQTTTPPVFVRTAGTQSLLTYTVPLANLGLTVGDTLFFDAYSSGSGGGDSAVDALSNTNISITAWVGPYTSSTNTAISSYTVGGAGGGGNVAETTIYVRLRGTAAANPSDGTVTLSGGGAPAKTVTLNGIVLPRPVITPTASLTPFAADLGTPSAAQSFSFVGTNLVGDVTLTAPAGFEISKTTNGTYTNTLTYLLAEAQPGPATNWVRLAATAPPGNVAGNIALASQGAVTTNVAVSGRVTGDPVIFLAPTNLTNFFAPLGAPSDAQSFIARGVDLDGDIVLTASSSTSWEIRDPATGIYTSTVTLVASNAAPVTFARDSATNAAYSGGWTNGSDGGSGFGPWSIAVDPGSDATATIGNPADAGITGMNSNSFALQGTNGYVTVQRPFDAPLLPGDTFSLQFGNNFDTGVGSGGNKGVNIFAGGFAPANQLININIAESQNITINGQPMFTQYGTAAVTLNFHYVAPGQLRVFGTGRNGTETFDQTFTVTGVPDGFSLYAGDLSAVALLQRVLYANDFAITSGSVGPSVNPTEILVRIKQGALVNPALAGTVTATSTGATTRTVTLEGIVSDKPEITHTSALVPFLAVQGFPSDPQTFTVGGNNLEAGVLVEPPPGYQVSTNGSSWDTIATVSRTGIITLQETVYIRIAPTTPVGTPGGNILLTSTNAPSVTISNITGSVVANPGPQLNASPLVLPAFATEVGTNSPPQTFVLTGQGLSNSVVLAAPSGFVLSTNATTFVSNTTLTPRASGFISNTISVRMAGTAAGIFAGNVTASSGATNVAVAVRGTVFDVGAQITAVPTNLSGFTTVQGTPSPAQSFQASARSLGTTNLVITSSVGYQLSTNSSNFFTNSLAFNPVAGAVDPVAVYVRIATNAPVTNALAGTVTLSSGAASPVTVALNGNVDPRRPPAVTLVSPSNNPTIIAPGSTIRLLATAVDTNVAGTAGTLATFQFLTNGVPIPGAATNNVLSPATLQYDWTPALTDLPAVVSARAADTENLTNDSTSVTVRFPNPGEPVAGFTPPALRPPGSQVEAVTPATGGAFYISGSFTNLVNNYGSFSVTNSASRLARILPDGEVDTDFDVGVGPNANARTMLYSARDKGLYIGGVFTAVAGVERTGLARLAVGQDGIDDGTLDADFAPALAGFAAPIVNAIVQQYDGSILVGGTFATANEVESANLARFHPDGSLDESFVPPLPNGEVKSIVLQPDGKILIGGSFALVAGQERKGVARLNTDGSLDETFQIGYGPTGGFGGTVWSVAVALDGSIYAGGQFGFFNGRSFYNNLIKLSPDGRWVGNFNYSDSAAGGVYNQNGSSSVVRNVQMRPGGGILVSGQFTAISNRVLFPGVMVPVGRIAEFLPDGNVDTNFNQGGAGADNSVLNATTLPNGNIVLVGAFNSYNGNPAPRMVVLAGSSVAAPMVGPPPFLTVDAGGDLDFTFTSPSGGPFDNGGALLPRGVEFDAATGSLKGIPLDAGPFDMDVSVAAPGGGFGPPSPFRLQVLPKKVPYETWKRVWFKPADWSNPAVSGPLAVGRNPSGQPNLNVYALDGGNPMTLGDLVMPWTSPDYAEGQEFMTYSVLHYPLADAVYSAQTSTDLRTWSTNTFTIEDDAGFFRVRPTVPMSQTDRQFFRLKISLP